MFIILLKFTSNIARGSQVMADHKEWIQRGFSDGVFLMVGSLPSGMGGGILANNISLDDLRTRINEDPFVVENVVVPEIIEISPSRTDDRLDFLLK